MTDEGLGLGEIWPEVIKSLRKLAPVYDRLNRIISLNTDISLRVEGVSGRVGEGELVLDAGAGNGIFTEILLMEQPNVRDVVMLDTLPEMLSKAVEKVNMKVAHPVVGVFEKIPFRANVFDCVLMGFSLRDAMNMHVALSEIRRVTQPNGKLIVVDLGKPDSFLKRIVIAVYWCLVAPLLAFIRLGFVGLNVFSIYKTYRRLPSNREMRNLLKNFFKEVEVREKVMGGVVIVFSR